MDIKLKYDSSFDKELSSNAYSVLSKFFVDPFDINFESDIKNELINNKIKTGREGWIYYEIKDKKFVDFSSSMFEQSDYEGSISEIESSGINIELLNDHSLCTVFLDSEFEKEKMLHPRIQENLSKIVKYINDTNIHIEVVYFNLGPQGFVVPHTDGNGHDNYYNAVLNLKCPKEGCNITVNDNTTTVFTNDIFLFDAKELHTAINLSKTDSWEFIAFRLKSNI
jgi:hypothetical protein